MMRKGTFFQKNLSFFRFFAKKECRHTCDSTRLCVFPVFYNPSVTLARANLLANFLPFTQGRLGLTASPYRLPCVKGAGALATEGLLYQAINILANTPKVLVDFRIGYSYYSQAVTFKKSSSFLVILFSFLGIVS